MDGVLKTMKPRSVKKTSPQQFGLLRSEMATHTAAALGYGTGRDRHQVDAEWKDIIEKLNAIGPPYRTLSEWKKVWSDVRLRSKRSICEEFQAKYKSESEDDILIETLNNASSFYTSQNSSDQDYPVKQQDDPDSSPTVHYISKADFQKKLVKRNERINTKKRTTPEQFKLLRQEMAKHPLAANGYGTGKDRYKVDEEWKEVLEKLYALGPPYRTLTEWKKVWSDVRLRTRKSGGKKIRIKKESESEDDNLMESLNDNSSIYASHNSREKDYSVPKIVQIQSATSAAANIEGEPYLMDERNPLDGTMDDNEFQNNNDDTTSYHHGYQISEKDESQCNDDTDPRPNDNLMEQTLNALQMQAEQHDKILQHLTKISTTMSDVMERQVMALESRNHILERQSKANEFHNYLQRRHELRRKGRSKINEWF